MSKKKNRQFARSQRARNKPLADVATFDDLRRHFDIAASDWDAFIITDGSGTTRENPMGWASVLIDREEVTPRIVSGSASTGTSNQAEILAAVWPLMDLVEQKKGVREHGYRVHVFSDSKYTVEGLNRDQLKWLPTMKKHKMLWMMVLGAKRSGLVITAHWIPRDTLDLNKICHEVANLERKKSMRLVDVCKAMPIEDFSP